MLTQPTMIAQHVIQLRGTGLSVPNVSDVPRILRRQCGRPLIRCLHGGHSARARHDMGCASPRALPDAAIVFRMSRKLGT